MKTFEQLNKLQREKAILAAFHVLVESVARKIIEVELVDPVNQRTLNRIVTHEKNNGGPRFAVLSILRNKGIRKELERLALVAANESMYDKTGKVIRERKQNVDSVYH